MQMNNAQQYAQMKLSIITINYNDAKGLEKTLESIIDKKNQDVELIVIDGGSTDTSLDVILHLEDDIDYYISESDTGIYNAMNKGIKKTRGEYLLFVNSGDELMETADLKSILQNTDDKDIIFHNLQIVENDNNYIKEYPKYLDFKYFIEDSLPHTATLIKKDLFTKFGYYNEEYKIVADWAFFIDCIITHRCSYKHVDACFSSFYIGGISSQPSNFEQLTQEKEAHIANSFPLYTSLYSDWKIKKEELYKLKISKSVQYIKKMGFLKWLEI